MRKQTRAEDMRRRGHVQGRVDPSATEAEFASGVSVLPLPDESVMCHPHRLEQDVRNRLMAEPSLNFTSLVVHRVRDGLCLEGVLEVDDADDVSTLVRQVCGATPVLNHLVVHCNRELPRKG